MLGQFQNRPASQRTTRRNVSRPRTPHENITTNAQGSPHINQKLPAPKIAQMLGNFLNLRSTVKNVSTSLQQMEKWLDNTYHMFEFAQTTVKQTKNRFPNLSRKQETEDIPTINFPQDGYNQERKGPQLDLGQIFKIMQSPIFRQLVGNLFSGNHLGTTSYQSQQAPYQAPPTSYQARPSSYQAQNMQPRSNSTESPYHNHPDPLEWYNEDRSW